VKKPYQITKRRAAEQFSQWAKTNEVPIQLTIPTAGIAELAQQSLGDLLRSVGKAFIESVMENEVEQLAGKRSERMTMRGAYRWGSEEGFCVIDGQKVPVDRPRLRSRQHESRDSAGKLRAVSESIIVGGNRVAQGDVRADDAQLQGGRRAILTIGIAAPVNLSPIRSA
jgi:hypothetical protein